MGKCRVQGGVGVGGRKKVAKGSMPGCFEMEGRRESREGRRRGQNEWRNLGGGLLFKRPSVSL